MVALARRAGKPAGGEGRGEQGSEAAVEDGESGGGGGLDVDDLLPRTDLSASISPQLLTAMGSPNWKDRKQALDDVDSLITQAGGRIQPQV